MEYLSDQDRENLTAYLDGELDEASARTLEAKLSLDPRARAEAEALQQAWGLLDYLPRSDPSPTFTHRTLERLAVQGRSLRQPAWKRWLAGLAWVTALVLALLGGLGGARLLWPPHSQPPDSGISRKTREQDGWLTKQPRAIRDELARLKGNERRQRLEALLKAEDRRRQEWQQAYRFWEELVRGATLPARLGDFPFDVQHYVKEYLQPLLSPEEKARLHKAEGQWPAFPQTLVEIADRHPLALPGPRTFLRWSELPAEVKKKLFKMKKDAVLPKALKAVNGHPGFPGKIVELCQKRQPPVVLPNELWAYSIKCLSKPMQQFVEKTLPPLLDNEESLQLIHAEKKGEWPEYPLTIKRLAEKHGLEVPWKTLPGDPQRWDRYRLKPKKER